MRQVNRSSVGMPIILDKDLTDELDKIRNGGKARPDIYRSSGVLGKLRVLYREKCYLCEKKVGDKGDVEHFLPWHRVCPERAYEWQNLHLSCKDCNSRKRNGKYRSPSSPKLPAEETLLIDPANPPFSCQVEELIKFNKYCEAVVGNKHASEILVLNTLTFLNDSMPQKNRYQRYIDITNAIFEYNCKQTWENILLESSIDPKKWEHDEDLFAKNVYALEKADAVYSLYLTDSSPFCTSIKSALFENLRLSAQDFRRMSNAYRDYKGMPII